MIKWVFRVHKYYVITTWTSSRRMATRGIRKYALPELFKILSFIHYILIFNLIIYFLYKIPFKFHHISITWNPRTISHRIKGPILVLTYNAKTLSSTTKWTNNSNDLITMNQLYTLTRVICKPKRVY